MSLATKANKRICPRGHVYYKSSECPTCPNCENQKRPVTGLLALVSAPARRALEGAGISSVAQLAKYSQKEIMSLHGIGPASLPIFLKALKKHGLCFKKF